MKMSTIKKALAVTLAMTMVMASALTVSAKPTNTTPNAGASSESSHKHSSSSSSASSNVVSAGGTVSVAGTSVQTSVNGTYAATKVKGVAIQAPIAEIAAALGLSSGQKPFVMVYDTDPAKSPAAMACVEAAAQSIGGTVVSAINVELGAKEAGKFVTLSNGSVGMKVGIPTVDPTKTYSMVCVQPGGIVTILEDQDTNPATITFAVQAGLGTYAIVAK